MSIFKKIRRHLALSFLVMVSGFSLVFANVVRGGNFIPSNESPPVVTREFRAAWVATVYNIDWPSSSALSAATQKRELIAILDRMLELKLNVIIFQVRSQADAFYWSPIEPWSSWLTGTMGKPPGYDPLAFCIKEAHARGIEVHAWFNPFRAMANAEKPVSNDHISRTHPSVIKKFKNYLWIDPASYYGRQRAITVMLDVVKRYDVDGVHIDDYFYPYPDVSVWGKPKEQFSDKKKPSLRRAYVDTFVRNMYQTIKKTKPWVRVGISPYGIWKPGVPRGTTAKLNAYEHLAADSRKWLQMGWCDYMSPQLYWRIEGAQDFTKLYTWWCQQGDRPIWPGIATSRIQSNKDPDRPAAEIINQITLTRRLTENNYVGHIHWSMNALLDNRDDINSLLKKHSYISPALVPPMPWLSQVAPQSPKLQVMIKEKGLLIKWTPVNGAFKYALQIRKRKSWQTYAILPTGKNSFFIHEKAEAVALSAVDKYGTTSRPRVLTRR